MRVLCSMFILMSFVFLHGCSITSFSINEAQSEATRAVYQLDGTWQMYAYELLEPEQVMREMELKNRGVTVSAPLSFQTYLIYNWHFRIISFYID